MSRPGVIGVLLAGGQSRRMGGGDKCLMRVGGQTMLARAIDRLRPQTDGLILNANGDPERFSEVDLPVAADPVEGFAGPLAGVLAGLGWARVHAPAAAFIATAATDTPFFPTDFVARCLTATDGNARAIVLARSGGRAHPVFGLWPTALASDLQDALAGGVRKVLDWTDRHDTRFADFGPVGIGGETIDPFFNANRPEDLTELERLLERAAA